MFTKKYECKLTNAHLQVQLLTAFTSSVLQVVNLLNRISSHIDSYRFQYFTFIKDPSINLFFITTNV